MRSRTERGFTLIEVMVALTIMTIVMTVAFSGLRTGLDSWQRGTRALDNMDRRATVERLLKRQLPMARSMQFTVDTKAITMFRGSANRIEFMADYSLADGSGDVRKIDYAFKDGHFLYGEKMLLDYVPMETELLPTTVLADFGNAGFQFLGVDDKGQPVWVDEWTTDKALPSAVRIQIDNDTIVTELVNR